MAGLIFKALLQHMQAGEASASLQHRMFTNRFDLQKARSLQCLMPSASALQFTASFTKCFANLRKQRSPWLCPLSCSWQCFYCDSPTEHCCEDLVHLEHSYYLLSFLFFWCMPDGRWHFPDLELGLLSSHTDPFKSACRVAESLVSLKLFLGPHPSRSCYLYKGSHSLPQNSSSCLSVSLCFTSPPSFKTERLKNKKGLFSNLKMTLNTRLWINSR